MHPDNIKAGKLFGLFHGFKVWTGTCYLGGFIGDNYSKRDCMIDRKLKWENNIRTIRKTADKYHQESYATVVRAIQLHWIFLKHVTKNMVDTFAGMDKLLWEIFLPRHFFRKPKYLPTIVGNLSTTTINKDGPGLQNPVMSANKNS